MLLGLDIHTHFLQDSGLYSASITPSFPPSETMHL